MAKFNRKAKDRRLDRSDQRVAGGAGAVAAAQTPEALLRRSVMACLLWEDLAYESGSEGAENIASLVPRVAPEKVAEIAIESREQQKLRHVPLWLAIQMLKHEKHRKLSREVINRVVTRPDQLTDLVALYWKEGKRPLPRQMKMGLADAFQKFDAYQFAKWDRDQAVKLRDVLRLCHAKPEPGKEDLFKQANERTLAVPDTWEVALSRGQDRKETWERLIGERKLGSLAFLRNLRNLVAAGVDDRIIRQGLEQLNDKGLLPLNFLAAQAAAPEYAAEIEAAMLRAYGQLQKLPGFTALVVDVSGSMSTRVSRKSQFSRIHAGAAMAILAREMSERIAIYVTAGNDGTYTHATRRLPNYRGFGLQRLIDEAAATMGGGGIFTRQCLEWIQVDGGLHGEQPDRIIVFSDSQDCDRARSIPAPFGFRNYIVDVSSHTHGINYEGVWDAEISGWSEHFLHFIAAFEGLSLPETELF